MTSISHHPAELLVQASLEQFTRYLFTQIPGKLLCLQRNQCSFALEASQERITHIVVRKIGPNLEVKLLKLKGLKSETTGMVSCVRPSVLAGMVVFLVTGKSISSQRN